MSKIYEALLRAESERGGTKGEARESSATALQDLLPPIEVHDHNDPASLDAEPPSSFEVTQHALLGEGALPINAVRRRWSPAPTALPALEERGAAIEQFRSLRSHVSEFREQRPLKSVLVSSGLPGEGKSFIALNLALSFARHKGSRVLLIDGDMRRSSLHKLLGAPREPGLSEYLAGEAGLGEILQQPDGAELASVPGLSTLTFVAGGRDADKAGDLAANTLFPELLATAGPAFDWIIVDSSPVNLVSDAVSLARACDGVLLVSREGVTRFKTAQQAQAQFKHCNVLGFVLNAVASLPKADYYGSYESYGAEA